MPSLSAAMVIAAHLEGYLWLCSSTSWTAYSLVSLFHLLGMIYPSLKRKCAPNPGWFTPTICSKDPDDDYLISLALSTQSVIVSGDSHLLALSDEIPVYSPTDF